MVQEEGNFDDTSNQRGGRTSTVRVLGKSLLSIVDYPQQTEVDVLKCRGGDDKCARRSILNNPQPAQATTCC